MRASPLVRSTLLAVSLVLSLVTLGWAQEPATITGQVVDAESGEPLVGAVVRALLPDASQPAGAVADRDGRFQLTVPPGEYTIEGAILGYAPGRVSVQVAAGESRTVSLALRIQAVVLNPIVVSASRTTESRLEAPATVAVVERKEIAERTATTVIDHVKGEVGVDIAQTGIQQSNVVTRGFNNVFSGAMLVLSDHRYARVPSLRVNAYNLIPTTNLDLERVELVLGPGAALYGPNSANGVLHMISTSPIDRPGTTASVAGGGRSIFQGVGRHASRIGENMGIKVSGQYFRGEDFRFIDPEEQAAREMALPGDPGTLIGFRHFDAERWSADVRFDARPWDDGEIVVAGGANRLVSSIELTGLGAAQADDWTYSYGQVRVRKGRLFAQSFINMSDAGDSYLLRTGQPIVDESFFLAGQVQHGFSLGDRSELLYGVDLQKTEPRTEGTITGRNEDDDTINEAGVYVHSKTDLTDRLDFLGAVRLDWHNRLEDPVFSPRAALVFDPAPDHSVRLTFNRAFSTPTTNNLFLDIVAGRIPIADGVGYDIRTLGTPESGFTWSRTCPGGFDGGLCMHSPFAPGQALPANAAVAWNALLQALAPPNLQPFLPLLLSDAPPVGTVLRRFDPEERTFVADPVGPTDIHRIEPTITNTVEVGYKGLIGGRVLLAADVYRSDIKDFVTPLRVETPTVFLDPTTTAAFIQAQLTPLVQQGQLTPEGLASIVQTLTGNLAMVPIGTVAPDQAAAADILLAYRNFGELDIWGADFATEVLLTDVLAARATYSWASEQCFDFDDNATCEDLLDVALNAPRHKGSIGLRYDDPGAGLAVEATARFVSEFVMNSGVYVGVVDGYMVWDANAEYVLPWVDDVAVGVSAYNLFDKDHREFIGAPEIGRILLLRVRYGLR